MSSVYWEIIISFLGGLGLFLYGMHAMASGLQKSAGNRMKKLLEVLTQNKITGIMVGTLVTAIIQSSSATTVMVVGFVNAGLMNLTQSVGVIMGANIGTTVTAWLVSSVEWAAYLNPLGYAPILIALGAFMVLFSPKDKIRQIGEIVVGFGILFVGMSMMSDAVYPLRESEVFKTVFLTLGSNPLLGILAGAVVTAIIQSSSASVSILQTLALAGLVPWNAAVYIIMGQNIGTCITAILSSIGTSKNAKSAAYIHLMFNVFGSVVFSIIAIIYFRIINVTFGNTLITITYIGIVHTAFNIANTILMYPFSDILVKIAKKLASSTETIEDESLLIHLDDRILETPMFAIENCIKEIVRLGYMSFENLKIASEALMNKDNGKIEAVLSREKSIDSLEQSITQYMVKLCGKDINEDENKIITSLFHTVNDMERVGDHSENIAELAQYCIAESSSFSDIATKELDHIISMTQSCFKHSLEALSKNERESARKAILEEEEIDIIERKLRSSHIERLAANECNPATGVIFLDVIMNLERISDHAQNIAELVLEQRTKKN